ncbi:Endonuclease/exonuclease/phosphatase [Macrolepiota fuliginosa MF-IS2]|uniref:Endonuclease/exonuclease/phosphatase n=1 Tax=Macrolepiota fuliginosa MF-IS2 TaxID=1400762 RepID=A0A9P5XP60_9AGAR|nr:Endonuclease/exonuclease/phosphatase [Macrolepiota fuliginosa MF-IS2]
MSSHRKYQPTPEEIAAAQAKKAERLKKKQEKAESSDIKAPTHTIIQRPWLTVPTTQETLNDKLTVKVFTWNLLAQCLVRRELFPASDCLKAGQREQMLQEELLSQDASILCLQEVDRLEKVLPILDQAGYLHRYAAGRRKKHGCLIAFKRKLFEQVHERVVFYDEQPIRDVEDERAQRGHSFNTRNIGLILALRFRDDPSNGIIVATTHLFWHPKYTYERARQAGILVREVLDLQKIQCATNWACIIAGDFNCPPNDAAYALLTGQPLNAEHKERLAFSRVTHVSVDPTVPRTPKPTMNNEEEGEAEAVDPDRVITSARAATDADGLLSNEELVALFSRGCRLRSAYGEGLSQIQNHNIALFGERVLLECTHPGFHEPSYTSYTHYWKSILDYIFFIPPQDQTCSVTGLLAPHRTEDFGPGLPLKGVCSSDHVSLTAELAWTKS